MRMLLIVLFLAGIVLTGLYGLGSGTSGGYAPFVIWAIAGTIIWFVRRRRGGGPDADTVTATMLGQEMHHRTITEDDDNDSGSDDDGGSVDIDD